MDILEADGVTGAGHVCAAKEKAEFEILTMVFGVIKLRYIYIN